MALFAKVTYVDYVTVIPAQNLNDIQTAIGPENSLDTTAQTLSGAINEHESELADKVDKVTGKGLSTNDYTDVAKGKVDALKNVSELEYEEVTS